jgi:hypothetical protein
LASPDKKVARHGLEPLAAASVPSDRSFQFSRKFISFSKRYDRKVCHVGGNGDGLCG